MKQVHLRVLQKVVQRLYDNLTTLKMRKDKAYHVNARKWNTPQEFRLMKYSQSGFELNNTNNCTVSFKDRRGSDSRPPRGPNDTTTRTSSSNMFNRRWFTVLGIETEDDAPPKSKNSEAHQNRHGDSEVRIRYR